MTCAVFCIGTELSRGELVNTNATWLADQLTTAGFDVIENVVVPDDFEAIESTLERLGRTVKLIVTTGGLGPTTDDFTSEAVARTLGVPFVRSEEALSQIRQRFQRTGRTMSPSNEKQAYFPETARILPNRVGSAPGFSVMIGKAIAFFLPGVPREMMQMFDAQVLPTIRGMAAHNSFQIRLQTYGVPESVVGEKLSDVERLFPGVTLGYRAHWPEIEVKVLARGDRPAAEELCKAATTAVRERLGSAIFGDGEMTFASVVGAALRQRGETLALAESCTGGLLGAKLTAEPGASDFLLVDAVTYSNLAKTKFLGVDEEILRAHGAVSAEVAMAMAEGVRREAQASIGLAITGIAGPEGGTDAKPVGLVFIAIAAASGTRVIEKRFVGDRQQIQLFSAYAAMKMLLDGADITRQESA